MKRRELTQRRDTPWPFKYSVTERGVVKNVPPTPRKTFRQPTPFVEAPV